MLAFIIFATIIISVVAEFNIAQANISLWVSTVTNCGAAKYKSHEFKGPIKGFVVTDIISDWKDTEGYIGYLPSDRSIFVTIRGTSSVRNVITDGRLFVQTNYTAAPECNCQVHKGFFEAEQTVFPQILEAVQKLQSQFPDYDVKLSGHSYGASLVHLIALDLIKYNVKVKQVYNFGQPKTGKSSVVDSILLNVVSFLDIYQVQKHSLITRNPRCPITFIVSFTITILCHIFQSLRS